MRGLYSLAAAVHQCRKLWHAVAVTSFNLLAGGLGSLGALVARWAAANPGAHVWLLSRSAHATRGRALGLPADSPAQVQHSCWAASVPGNAVSSISAMQGARALPRPACLPAALVHNAAGTLSGSAMVQSSNSLWTHRRSALRHAKAFRFAYCVVPQAKSVPPGIAQENAHSKTWHDSK